MSKNIEAFVETLKTEGVLAGKQAAAKIEAEAKAQAERVIAEAETEAQKRIAEAQAEVEQIKARTQTNLDLAARDTVLHLQERLITLLTHLVHQEVEQQLSDDETLSTIMREVIPAYLKAASGSKGASEIHIPQDMHSRLVTGALRELSRSLKNQNVQADVQASLAKAGFAYKTDGSTVEVTAETVTALLSDLIDPELRKVLSKASVDQCVAG